MRRVLVLGPPGAGKSTFCRQLAEKAGLPIVHLDRLFWTPGWVMQDRAVFYAAVETACAAPEWIMDGNYSRTLELRLARADTVVYLESPRVLSIWRVILRTLKAFGRSRPDMADGCPERFTWSFLSYVWTFDRSERPPLLAILQENGAAVRFLRGERARRAFLETATEADCLVYEN